MTKFQGKFMFFRFMLFNAIKLNAVQKTFKFGIKCIYCKNQQFLEHIKMIKEVIYMRRPTMQKW